VPYYHHPHRHLVADERLEIFPVLPPLEDHEGYVEFYMKDAHLYTVRHKQRSYELSQSSDNVSGDDLPHSTKAASGKDYWRYIKNHPSHHSEIVRNLLLDVHREVLLILPSLRLTSGKLVPFIICVLNVIHYQEKLRSRLLKRKSLDV
jgi:hypothetical protein